VPSDCHALGYVSTEFDIGRLLVLVAQAVFLLEHGMDKQTDNTKSQLISLPPEWLIIITCCIYVRCERITLS